MFPEFRAFANGRLERLTRGKWVEVCEPNVSIPTEKEKKKHRTIIVAECIAGFCLTGTKRGREDESEYPDPKRARYKNSSTPVSMLLPDGTIKRFGLLKDAAKFLKVCDATVVY